MSTPYGPPPPKAKVRPFTWVILAITVLFLVWIIVGIVSVHNSHTNCNSLDTQTCNDAKNAGAAIGVSRGRCI